MKARRGIYIIIGTILIVINLFSDIVQVNELRNEQNNASYSIGYFIGSHLLLIFGLIFLRMAYKLKLKILRTEINNIEKEIGKIGSGQ